LGIQIIDDENHVDSPTLYVNLFIKLINIKYYIINFFPKNNENEPSICIKTNAIVTLNHIHNHQILWAEVLKHRIPSNEVKEKFLKLFEEGKTLTKALFIFKSELRNNKGNAYYIYAGDRAELPDPQ